MKGSILALVLIGLSKINVVAQCAMCRGQVESNIASGDTSLAAGLNMGIIYLFIMPYILLGIVAYLWWKNSHANTKSKRTFSNS